MKPAIVWTPVTNTIADDGTNRSATITPNPAERQRYYRLKK